MPERRRAMTLQKPSSLSARLANASILLYLFWLLLPAVQTTGRALTGVVAVALFGAAVIADTDYLKQSWLSTLLRAACAAAMPLLMRFFLRRGGANFAGFYVQQAMFWFPLVFAGYARERGDSRLWRWVKPLMLAVVTVTTLTTIGWLIQGMLRGGRVYAYSRSLGYAGEGREAYLKELMLRNIGGYDFIYATVVSLPLTCLGVQRSRGWARAGYGALLAAQAVMVALSQYTYAMVFTAAILVVEGVAAAARALSRGRLGMGASLLWGAAPLAVVILLREPLVSLAARVCGSLGLTNFAHSFEMLLGALQGGGLGGESRLTYYLTALEGFRQSPLVGGMLGGEPLLSLHSDLLDLLSGMGVLGAALVGGMIYLMGRGLLSGVRRSPARAQLVMMTVALFACALLGTVVYSRDILAVAAMGTLLVLEGEA